MDGALWNTSVYGGSLSIVLILTWPFLALSAREFTKSYFGFWVAIAFIWVSSLPSILLLFISPPPSFSCSLLRDTLLLSSPSSIPSGRCDRTSMMFWWEERDTFLVQPSPPVSLPLFSHLPPFPPSSLFPHSSTPISLTVLSSIRSTHNSSFDARSAQVLCARGNGVEGCVLLPRQAGGRGQACPRPLLTMLLQADAEQGQPQEINMVNMQPVPAPAQPMGTGETIMSGQA